MPVRLVAIGDSTVEGVEDPGPDGAYIGWADRFAGHLDAIHPGLLYANLAVRGQTAREVRQTQLRPALALAPDFAVVVAGVNDVLRPKLDRDALRDDLCTMHAELAATGARVLTLTMPDMARVAPLAVVLRRRLQFLNSVTYECGERYGSIIVDLASVPPRAIPSCGTPTGCTPTAKGTAASPPGWPRRSATRWRTGGRSRRRWRSSAVCASPSTRPPGPARICCPGPGDIYAGTPPAATWRASARRCRR